MVLPNNFPRRMTPICTQWSLWMRWGKRYKKKKKSFWNIILIKNISPGSTYHGYRSSHQINQQSRHSCTNYQRIRYWTFPCSPLTWLRFRSRKNHHKQKTQFDIERWRCYRYIICGHATKLWIVHKVKIVNFPLFNPFFFNTFS